MVTKKIMFYNNLITNNKIIKKFQDYINNENIPHAFLFYGDPGIGKFAHAIEFVNMLLQKNDDSENIENKLKKNTHENINFITPLPKSRSIKKHDSALNALNEKDLEKLNEEMILKLNNPYHLFSLEKANTILINSIRDLKKRISLSNFNNSLNIHIILEADKMCYPRVESANSLLKIIEEPKENNIFILITSNINQMIDTITSRCTKIYFSKPAYEKIASYYENEFKLERSIAQQISNLCNGNLYLANHMKNNYKNIFNDLDDFLNIIFENKLDLSFKLTKRLDKNELKNLIYLLEVFINDIIVFKKTNTLNKTRFIYKKNYIKELSMKYNDSDLNILINTIHSINKNIDKNVYTPLLLNSFFIEINNVLNKHFKPKTLMDKIIAYE